MIAAQQADVVAIILILPVPEPLLYARGIYVVRDQCIGGRLAADFYRAAQSRQLRRSGSRRPLPPVAQIVRAKIVHQVRTDRRRKAYGNGIRLLRSRGLGGG